MDLSVASSLHGNKITADKDLQKAVPEIRNITGPTLHACASHHRDHKQIHGLHHSKDGMAYFKTDVELMPIRCID